MDWLQFVSTSLGQLLSWPVAAVVLGIVFKKAISDLFRKLQSWKNGPAGDFDFGRGVGQAESAVDAFVGSIAGQSKAGGGTEGGATAPANDSDRAQPKTEAASGDEVLPPRDTPQPANAPQDFQIEHYKPEWSQIATENPSYLLLSSWEDLTESLQQLAMRAQGAGLIKNRRPASQLIPAVRELSNAGIVNSNFVDAFNQLRELRNRVAHGQHNPTAGEAITYAETARELGAAAAALGRNIAIPAL